MHTASHKSGTPGFVHYITSHPTFNCGAFSRINTLVKIPVLDLGVLHPTRVKNKCLSERPYISASPALSDIVVWEKHVKTDG